MAHLVGSGLVNVHEMVRFVEVERADPVAWVAIKSFGRLDMDFDLCVFDPVIVEIGSWF